MTIIKKVVFIIGMIAAVMNFMQSSAACWAGRFFDEPSLFHGGNACRLVALFFLIGAVIALFKITIAVAIFIAAGLMAIISGVLMDYYEMVFWGIISLIIAVIGFMARAEEPEDEEFEDIENPEDPEDPEDPKEDKEETIEKEEEPSKEFFSEREMLLNKRTRHY